MKEKLTVTVECDADNTFKIISAIKKLNGEIKEYNVTGIKPDKKVGF